MSLSRPRHPDLAIGAGFLLLALILRAPSFLCSVVDWDESLYFLMAEAWRHGHLPYTVLWDNKPIGIYAIFAAFQAVFGDHVAAMRLAAIMAVAATAFLLHRLTGRLIAAAAAPRPGALWPGLFAGAVYLVATLSSGGFAANTELFMTPFVVLALLLALESRMSVGRAGAIGLLLGLACMIKYVAAFEGLFIFCLVLARPAGGFLPKLAGAVLFLLGGLVPLGVAMLPYLEAHRLGLFFASSFAANVTRVAVPASSATFEAAMGVQFALWGALYILAALLPLVTVWRRYLGHGETRYDAAPLLIGWFVAAALGVVAAKSFYGHYFLQALPSLSVIAAWSLARLAGRRERIALGLFVLAWLGHGAAGTYREVLGEMDWQLPGLMKDPAAVIARAMEPVLKTRPDAGIYVFDYEPILYSLTGRTPPTRYAFPSFMVSRFLSEVAGARPLREFAAIMAQKPLFVIRSRLRHPTARNDNLDLYAAFDAAMRKDYVPWAESASAIVYRLRE